MALTETDRVRRWLEQAVLGLGLCPFAAEPWHAGRIRLIVTPATSEQALLEDLHAELAQLAASDPQVLETTLLIIPNLLQDFDDYNQFLDPAEALIDQFGWTGQFQIASFHPQYQFGGTAPDDVSNLTNRSPFPLLHLLRESSVSRAVAEHGDTDRISRTNIATLQNLTDEQRREIFGFLPDE